MAGETALQAGMKTMTVHGKEPMPVALFYPTRAQARVMTVGPFAPFVAFNGAPELPVKGLILLSHGTGGSQLAHHNLARQLAQNGYLVAAPQHPGDNWEDRSLASSATYFAERPRQLSRLLDAVLADSQWRGQIPAGRIGALGFSAGGFSVLALAGGIADRQRALRHCAETDDDSLFCRLGGDSANAADATAVIDFDLLDPRVRAVFAMAPIGVVFAPESLARIKLPLKLVTAAKDEVLTPKYHGDWLRARLPQAEFEQVPNAGHFAFMAQPTMPLMSDAGDPGDNPPGFDRPAYLLRLERQVVEFFDKNFGELPA
ncbi:alpha/beta hydrolase family protein [Paraherbaspirillum soli]|uniref:Alpha/beta hydrolase family protein n=1 Tax=Paraherbaspirillum soli TaxID=631222 RepID=A0ABW0M5I8_9BURK